MKLTKRFYQGIFTLGVLVLLTACGKAKRDDIASELKANADVEASAGNAGNSGNNAGSDEVPDTISYVVEGNGNTVRIDAKVYADGYGNTPVFSVKRNGDKEEWVSRHAKQIFDDGQYDNVKPYMVQNREELEENLQFYKECEANGYVDAAWNVQYIQYMLDHFNESDYVQYPDDKLIYTKEEQQIGADNEEFTDTINEASLRGYVDGKLWSMSYSDGTYEGMWDETGVVAYEYMPRLEACCIEKKDYTYRVSDITQTYVKNECSREDAEKQAKEFLNKHGFENMELLHIAQTDRQSEEGDIFTDGYLMVYGMAEDRTHLLFSYATGRTIMDFATHNYAMQPYVEVLVDSSGVYNIVVMGDYEEPEIISGESEMLTFEQVNDIAEEMLNGTISGDTSYSNIDVIEFGYVYITYDGLSYAVVPAWRYYDGDRNENPRQEILTICALDGAVIFGVSANYYGLGTSLISY